MRRSVVMMQGPGVVAPHVWTFAPYVFPQTLATFSDQVSVEGRQEHSSSSTDIHPFLKRLNHSYVCVWPRALSPNVSVSKLCVLGEYETEFDANPLLFRISHFSRSVRPQGSINKTS